MVERKSLGDLLAETPQLIVGLIKAEIQHLKDELSTKAAGLGAGAGVLAGAGFFAVFLFGWLLVAAFEGLNVVFPPWLSALLVSAFLLLVAGILVLVGLGLLKKNKDFSNLEAVDSIKDDVNMVRGVGYAAEGRSPLDDLPTTNGAPR
ncbi:phage holin family protein [Agrococcus beijingensis]|uniref:phage holin family protein n=1 Tax=Agrococcus beijingensis TaxID=3068634 RepID=UPI002740800E|nr:phage holin family protein [Agrococcus sp. REN33]